MRALSDSRVLDVLEPPALPASAVLAQFTVGISMHWAAPMAQPAGETAAIETGGASTPSRTPSGRWSIPLDSILLSSSARRTTRSMRSPGVRATGVPNVRLLKSDLNMPGEARSTLVVYSDALATGEVAVFLSLRDCLRREVLKFQVDASAPHDAAPAAAKASTATTEAQTLHMTVPILVQQPDGGVRRETLRIFHSLAKDGASVDGTGRAVTLMHPASMLPCAAEYMLDGQKMDTAEHSAAGGKATVLDVSDTIASIRSAHGRAGDASLTSSLAGLHLAVVAYGLTFKTASDVKALDRAIKAALSTTSKPAPKVAVKSAAAVVDSAPVIVESAAVAAPAAVTAPRGTTAAEDDDDDTSYETADANGGSNLGSAFTMVPQAIRPLPPAVSCHAHMMLLKYAGKGWEHTPACAAATDALRAMALDSNVHESKRVQVACISLPSAIPTWRAQHGTAVIDAAVAIPTESLTIVTSNNESVERQIASLTKCMTALMVLGISDALIAAGVSGPTGDGVLAAPERGLASELRVTARAAAVNRGTKAVIHPGERFTVLEMLHGMMLPSGNDAATALAEAYGPYCAPESEEDWRPYERAPYYETQDWQRTDAVSRFVTEMNRTARSLGMASTVFANPHGLVHHRHRSCATDVARMIHSAMTDARFRAIVSCRRFNCDAQLPVAVPIAAPVAVLDAGVPEPVVDTSVDALTHALHSLAIAAPAPEGAAAGAAVSAASATAEVDPPPAAAPAVASAVARKSRPAPLVSRRKVVPTTRRVTWTNTNRTLGEARLLRGFSFTGIKTGITSGAFGCLTLHAVSDDPLTPAAADATAAPAAADASREQHVHAHLYGITLGSRSKFHRFLDNTQLLQWSVDALSSVGAFNAPPG